MDNPVSIAGQILSLRDRGYSVAEIVAELKSRPGLGKLSPDRVRSTIRQAESRSLDSRRLFEVYEAVLESLAILREIRGMDPAKVSARMHTIEKRDLPMKLGAAIDRLTGSG